MAELHVTVDTQIIMIGAGMSNIPADPSHQELLDFFHAALFLALDNEMQIRTEYERKMGAESVGRKWLMNLALNDRIRMHDLVKLPKKVQVQLDKVHFHQTDRKFVRLAMATESKCLVAEESDYSDAVRKVLRKHADVFVLDAAAACEWIRANRAKPPTQDGS